LPRQVDRIVNSILSTVEFVDHMYDGKVLGLRTSHRLYYTSVDSNSLTLLLRLLRSVVDLVVQLVHAVVQQSTRFRLAQRVARSVCISRAPSCNNCVCDAIGSLISAFASALIFTMSRKQLPSLCHRRLLLFSTRVCTLYRPTHAHPHKPYNFSKFSSSVAE